MKKIIFHGSDHIVENPVFGQGKIRNDYGQGFYCTEDETLAKEWSVEVNRDGFLNCYSLDLSGLKILNLNANEYSALHWITILIQNRIFDISSDFGLAAKEYLVNHFLTDISQYDVIIGYRADDSYFAYAEGFLNNSLSLGTLSEALYLGNLGEQIVLKSKRAFGQIDFLSAEETSAAIWYPKKEARDSKAREDFKKIKNKEAKLQDVYIIELIRNGKEE